MEHSSLSVVPNLGVMSSCAVGDAPGSHDTLSGQLSVAFASVGFVQDQAPVAILPPSDRDIRLAIQAGSDALKDSRDNVTRALLMQQDVLLRHMLFQRFVASSSGSTSFVSLTSSSSSSASGGSPQSCDGQPGVTAGVAAGVINKVAPPKNFRCPMCPATLNERDFARHIDSWLKRDGSQRLRSNQCPGVVEDHIYLRGFQGSAREKVRCFHAEIRRLIHPGCDAARSPQGSGNHIAVEAYLRQLSKSSS